LGVGIKGLGDWAKPTIPTPQSPIPNPHEMIFIVLLNIKYVIIINKN